MIYSELPPSHYEHCVRRLDGYATDEDEYGNYNGDDLIHFDDSRGFCTKGLTKQELWDLLNEH